MMRSLTGKSKSRGKSNKRSRSKVRTKPKSLAQKRELHRRALKAKRQLIWEKHIAAAMEKVQRANKKRMQEIERQNRKAIFELSKLRKKEPPPSPSFNSDDGFTPYGGPRIWKIMRRV